MKLRILVLIALVLLPAASLYAVGDATGRGDPIPLGRLVAELPRSAEKVTVRMTTHYYAGGLFLRKSGDMFLVVRPPTGAVVRSQPRSAVRVRAHGVRFYYHDGFFYRRRGSSKFEVVPGPAGAVVRSIPVNSRRRVVAKREAWWYAGVTYRPFQKSGRTLYRVMGL